MVLQLEEGFELVVRGEGKGGLTRRIFWWVEGWEWDGRAFGGM